MIWKAFCLFAHFAWAVIEEDDVAILNGENFDDFINPEKNFVTMVEFYAPWCGHCKQFAPVYSEIGKARVRKILFL